MAVLNPLITALGSDVASGTASSVTAASGFPAVNALDFLNPRRTFKGTGNIADERLVIDFGATTQLDAVGILNCNWGLMTVAGHATDSWGSPSYADAVSVNTDGADGMTKVFVDLSATTWASTGYRYLALIPSGASGTGLEIGGVIPLTGFTTWAKNPNPPYGRTVEDAVRRRERLDGGVQHATLGPVRADLTFELRTMVAAQDADYFALQTYGRGSPIIVYRNVGDASELYVGHRVFAQRHDERGGRLRSAQPLVIRSVV